MLYNEGGVYMPRVYFGYIQDVYPAYRCTAKTGSGQGPNIFIEFLKKELNWSKHYGRYDFKEEYFDIDCSELKGLWKKFEESGIKFKTGLLSTQTSMLKPHEATIQQVEVSRLPRHIKYWLRGY